MSAAAEPLAAPNGIAAVDSAGDIVDNGALSSAPDSPAVPSPVSPYDASPTVKIDTDYLHRDNESDSRHEPLDLNISQLDKTDDASTRPQLGTPADPDSIPIAPPKGTPPPAPGQLLEDVQMAESVSDKAIVNGINGGVNGVNGHPPVDDEMNVDTPSPAGLSHQSPMDAKSDVIASSSWTPETNGVTEGGPPAKRARTSSDADQASIVHPDVALPTDVPSNVAQTNGHSLAPAPQVERKTTLSQAQFRFCISTVRTLRKMKDASPFLHPVDPVALNIPHYATIIKRPMDFSTIDRKLASSNPSKPDPNPNNPRYLNADEFIDDVRLIFQNCITFNGPEHMITQMGKRVESVFDKQIKQLPPPAEEPKPQVAKKPSTPPPAVTPVAKKAPAVRRPSTSVPTIRRSEVETARPKREIHPPPPKDLPYADVPRKVRAARKGKFNDGTEEQLKFCAKIVNDLHKKSYYNFAQPFYEPVDPVKLNIPTYFKIVKKPMDLATMRKKLENKEYPNAEKFHDDFALMIRNCMAFNPVGTVVHNAGVELQRLFQEKWASLPPLRTQQSEDEDEDEEDEDSDEDRNRAIALMESQIETMKNNLVALKSTNKKPKKEKKEKKREKHVSPPAPSTSKANGKVSKPMPKKKSSKKNAIPDDDVLSFDQKKDLSETIQTLDGDKLENVIRIIHEGVPEIRDSTEEIELDIDQLPAPVLMKLYNFVLRPLRPPPAKRARTGTGTGTGGLKRKSMDEDVEAEKIRQLEERMRMFDNKHAVGMGVPKRDEDSEHSSDDSSSDSSGSDSE